MLDESQRSQHEGEEDIFVQGNKRKSPEVQEQDSNVDVGG